MYILENVSELLWYSSGHFSSCLSFAVKKTDNRRTILNARSFGQLAVSDAPFTAEKGEKMHPGLWQHSEGRRRETGGVEPMHILENVSELLWYSSGHFSSCLSFAVKKTDNRRTILNARSFGQLAVSDAPFYHRERRENAPALWQHSEGRCRETGGVEPMYILENVSELLWYSSGHFSSCLSFAVKKTDNRRTILNARSFGQLAVSDAPFYHRERRENAPALWQHSEGRRRETGGVEPMHILENVSELLWYSSGHFSSCLSFAVKKTDNRRTILNARSFGQLAVSDAPFYHRERRENAPALWQHSEGRRRETGGVGPMHILENISELLWYSSGHFSSCLSSPVILSLTEFCLCLYAWAF